MTQRARVLLVDDDGQVLFVLRAALQRMAQPCHVETARDGQAAYQLWATAAFDLLVTDIRLPEVDGITLTELVRAQAPQFPVIWITAYGCRVVREDAARLHVFRCLEKPMEVAEFRRIVRQALDAPSPVGAVGAAAPPAT